MGSLALRRQEVNVINRSVLDGYPCPDCSGTGEVVFAADDFDWCANCLGTGLVDQQPQLFQTGKFTVTPEKIRAARVLDALSDKPRSVYSLAVGLRLTTSEVYSALRSLVASGEAQMTAEGEFVKDV